MANDPGESRLKDRVQKLEDAILFLLKAMKKANVEIENWDGESIVESGEFYGIKFE